MRRWGAEHEERESAYLPTITQAPFTAREYLVPRARAQLSRDGGNAAGGPRMAVARGGCACGTVVEG